MEKKLFSILIFLAGFLSSRAGIASDIMPIFRSTSSVPLIVYSVKEAKIVDDYFFPNDPLKSVAFVRLTGTYESKCTSVELSAHMTQSMTSKNEFLTELSIMSVSAAGESVGVEPKICTPSSVPKAFDLKLNFQPKFWDHLPGERQWKVKIKYGKTGKENEYSFVVKLNSNTGFSLIQ